MRDPLEQFRCRLVGASFRRCQLRFRMYLLRIGLPDRNNSQGYRRLLCHTQRIFLLRCQGKVS